eukprot:TRINITY_DN37207_c0_g1_i1.p2 TRINITY_DN37207_c0_g1~~TRINITY_DN37207_c0_g1_i1.p2  ORF type:complete len:205 (+),score=15.68 TRINITY_DN37207_c0_g1_i1:64-678(+)
MFSEGLLCGGQTSGPSAALENRHAASVADLRFSSTHPVWWKAGQKRWQSTADLSCCDGNPETGLRFLRRRRTAGPCLGSSERWEDAPGTQRPRPQTARPGGRPTAERRRGAPGHWLCGMQPGCSMGPLRTLRWPDEKCPGPGSYNTDAPELPHLRRRPQRGATFGSSARFPGSANCPEPRILPPGSFCRAGARRGGPPAPRSAF